MQTVILFLTSHGLVLLAGSTILLGCGTLLVVALRSPLYQQRVGEATIACTLLWLAIACVPMQRAVSWSFESKPPAESGRSGGVPASEPVAPSAELSGTTDVTIIVAASQGTNRWERSGVDSSYGDSYGDSDGGSASGNRTDISRSTPPGKTSVPTVRHCVVVYVIGAICAAAWIGFGHLLLAWYLWKAKLPEAWLDDVYQAVARRRRARLAVSASVRRPFSHGILRPTIGLPLSLCRRENLSTIRHVLLHEQAHIERHDARGHAVFNLALPLLFAHPLYWLLRNRVSFAREVLADDWAAGRTDKGAYVEDLVRLVQQRSLSWLNPIGVMGMSQFRNPFCRRMNLLVGRTQPLDHAVSQNWFYGFLLATILTAVGLGSVFGVGSLDAADETIPGALNASDPPIESDPAIGKRTQTGETVDENSVDNPAPLVGVGRGRWRRSFTSGESDTSNIPGYVDVMNKLSIASSVDGVIAHVAVRPGASVEKGELLFTLNNWSAAAQLRTDRIAEKIARTKSENDIDVRYAAAQVKVLEAEYAEALKANTRLENSVSVQESNRRKFALERGRLALEQAERDKQLNALEAELKSSVLNTAQVVESKLVVKAPISGVVSDLQKQPGEWVQAGTPVVLLYEMDQMRVGGFVSSEEYNPEDLVEQHVSMEVARAGGQQVRFSGKVVYVSPDVDPNGGIRFWAQVANRKKNETWILRPGMRANIQLKVPRHADAQVSETFAQNFANANAETERADPQIVEILEEQVRLVEETWVRVKALFDSGSQGGDAHQETLARYEMLIAKARLAQARGDQEDYAKQIEAAVAAAQARVEATTAAMKAGAVTLDMLLDAQKKLAEVKLMQRRFR